MAIGLLGALTLMWGGLFSKAWELIESMRRVSQKPGVSSFSLTTLKNIEAMYAMLTADQVAKLGAKRPKVVAVCSGDMPRQVDLRRRFEQKLVETVILSRRDAPTVLPASDSLQAWFDHFFVVASQANLAELLPPILP